MDIFWNSPIPVGNIYSYLICTTGSLVVYGLFVAFYGHYGRTKTLEEVSCSQSKSPTDLKDVVLHDCVN